VSEALAAMRAELERDGESLTFLPLAEALRLRGDLDGAARVALAGLAHHPNLADAHDVFARILADAGDLQRAADEWGIALALDPRHGGAHKGLGFLAYRRGELDRALDHLELALSADPSDRSVVQALLVVRGAHEAAAEEAATSSAPWEREAAAVETAPVPPPAARTAATVFAGLEGGEHGMLLLDPRGRTLAGGLRSAAGANVADEVAAYLAGVSQEAERTSRLLELGDWRWIAAEAEDGTLHLSRPVPEALLLLARDRSVPAGRMGILAVRASDIARRWLEAQVV